MPRELIAHWNPFDRDVIPVPCDLCSEEHAPEPEPRREALMPLTRRSSTDYEFTFDPVTGRWGMTLITTLGTTGEAEMIARHYGLEAEAAFEHARQEYEDSLRDVRGAEAAWAYDNECVGRPQ